RLAQGLVPVILPAGMSPLNENQPPFETFPPMVSLTSVACHADVRSAPPAVESATNQYCVLASSAMPAPATLAVASAQQRPRAGMLVVLPPPSRVPTTPPASVKMLSLTCAVPSM